MLITQAEFAKLAGVKNTTVSGNINDGYLVREKKTGRMDPEHPKNKKYLNKRLKIRNNKKRKEEHQQDIEADEQIKEFADMAQLEQQFKVEKLKADVQIKGLLLQEKRGDLVSKQKLGDVCFSYLDVLNKNLLVVPQVFLDRVENYVKHKKDGKVSKKEMMNEIAKYITKAIKTTKTQVEKKMKVKYEIDEVEDEE